MSSTPPNNVAAELSCEVCGRLPEPPKTRLTMANIAAMLPLELAIHAAIVHAELPDVIKILILAVTTCALGIWVA
ncbi:MAG TPA: amino acid-binding protein, partial [Arthrobacter sp.]|nr:amino acid-binding protein [Arthrobacter sp.]